MDFIPASSNDVLKVICVLFPKTTIYPWQKTIDNIEHSWEKQSLRRSVHAQGRSEKLY